MNLTDRYPADQPIEDKPCAEMEQRLRESSYEYGLPDYLQRDLDAFKEGLKNGSSLLDCLWVSYIVASTLQKSTKVLSHRNMQII